MSWKCVLDVRLFFRWLIDWLGDLLLVFRFYVLVYDTSIVESECVLALWAFVEDGGTFIGWTGLDCPEVHGMICAFRTFLLESCLVGFAMFVVFFFMDSCWFLLRGLVLLEPLLFLVAEFDARHDRCALIFESRAHEITFRAIHLVREQRHFNHITALRTELTRSVQVSNLDFHCVGRVGR